jgi:hypothetical protein
MEFWSHLSWKQWAVRILIIACWAAICTAIALGIADRISSEEAPMPIDQSIDVEVIHVERDEDEPKYGREVVDREVDAFCEEQRELGNRLPKICTEEKK